MTRILFVDDEPQLLEGLRDLLRKQRREWTMVFALGAEAALAELAAATFDFVVSDMRMAGGDGATLLGQVRERYPSVVRMVLSGQTSTESALRAVPVAHRFLAKPCQPSALIEAVASVGRAQAFVRDPAVRCLATAVGTLPSAARSHAALVAALSSAEPSVEAASAIVERDVAMCAKVLQLVNSAFFGLGRRITNVSDAVAYLGIPTLAAVAARAGTFESSSRRLDVEMLDAHSLRVARTAASLVAEADADDAFVAGLLHDIGKLVLPQDTADVTHADVGAYLLSLWGLPHAIVDAVAAHHAPQGDVETPDVPAAVWMANCLAKEQAAAA
jgi:putative nucleotidyltransferase with HDIG domain